MKIKLFQLLIGLFISFNVTVSFGQQRNKPGESYIPRFGFALFGTVISGNELMVGKSARLSYRMSSKYSITGSFQLQDYLFETDCGYHRNNSEDYGVSLNFYPVGIKSRFSPYLKVGVVYQNII